MKSTIICTALLFSMSIFAQSEKDEKHKNELKLNIPTSIGGYIDGSFERLLNDEAAMGVSIGFSLEDDIDYKLSIVPYYRFYFGKKRAAGFFVEANGSLYLEEYETPTTLMNDMIIINSKSTFGAGLGMAIGGKFINSKGWVGEIIGGVGRNFLNTEKISGTYPRVGLSIGKRF
jgi:hypothetical protein